MILRTSPDRHSLSISHTKRYGEWISEPGSVVHTLYKGEPLIQLGFSLIAFMLKRTQPPLVEPYVGHQNTESPQVTWRPRITFRATSTFGQRHESDMEVMPKPSH